MQFGTTLAVVFTAASAFIPTVTAAPGLGCTYSIYGVSGQHFVDHQPVKPGGIIKYKIYDITYTLHFSKGCVYEKEKTTPMLPQGWRVWGHIKGQQGPAPGSD
ncbi:hypothetical protein PspLS_09931 [Pyricularia sp. CBS 133598]|nr:hypothetical protein PspLS_09931 [Pyricularia sp. CBS 133598]